ncbi:hypothetical protein [Actinokineospora inagensis]|uniref:hypothetical protein n=1 Tax=Actinokineospora inagensis TaxID=103730 RepID=UPI00047B255F|nr:hypothetical protein [Actinokineospora inagensis]
MSQPRDSKGRWTKVRTGAGVAAAGTVAALVMAGVDGGAAGVAAESASAAEDAAAQQVKSDRAGRKAKSDQNWRKVKVRQVREAAEHALDCAINSYGQVRDFFLRNPCADLDRTLFTLVDPAGNQFVVSVSWVRMRRTGDVRDLKRLIDQYGTGSVKSIGFDLLKSQGIRYPGDPFRSRAAKDVLVVAEGAVVSGHPDPALYRTAVDLAAELPV